MVQTCGYRLCRSVKCNASTNRNNRFKPRPYVKSHRLADGSFLETSFIMQTVHQPGDLIRDRYQVIRLLGHGGSGITYEAKDLECDRRVALKVLSLHQITDWKILELFEREAKVLENLHHPQIPAYLAHFQVDTASDHLFYLVQALAIGDSLATLVDSGWHANEAEVKRIAQELLSILDYLHRLTPPVIHRDIKPQNIIRGADGAISLVDFGAVQTVYRNTVSIGSTFVGTFGYMPPEQFRGKAYFASDLYSLGTTLLFLLTHRSPADLPQERMRIRFRDRVHISDAFADWLEKMVEPVVEDRFQSAQEALNALQDESNYLVPVTSNVLWAPQGSRVKLHRSHDRLIIEIPPGGWFSPVSRDSLRCLFYLAISCSVLVGALICISFGMNASHFVMASIWFIILYSLGLVQTMLLTAHGSARLEIDRFSFKLQSKFLGFRRHDNRGETAHLIKAAASIPSGFGGVATNLVLWEKEYKRGFRFGFGFGLTEGEQQWLASEITSFLEQIRD